jgi:hypothetical protein
MIRLILNDQHLAGALGEAIAACRHRLFICTADVKDLHVTIDAPQPGRLDVPAGGLPDTLPARGGTGSLPGTLRARGATGGLSATDNTPASRRTRRDRARSILAVFRDLSRAGIEIRLLHSGVPSGPFLSELKKGIPKGLVMRRCPRVHAKAVIADGRLMYLGSANLTGAGLGAKSARRRNFEAGIWTDDVSLIDPVLDMLDAVWGGSACEDCGRKAHCPVPLEEPRS